MEKVIHDTKHHSPKKKDVNPTPSQDGNHTSGTSAYSGKGYWNKTQNGNPTPRSHDPSYLTIKVGPQYGASCAIPLSFTLMLDKAHFLIGNFSVFKNNRISLRGSRFKFAPGNPLDSNMVIDCKKFNEITSGNRETIPQALMSKHTTAQTMQNLMVGLLSYLNSQWIPHG